MNKTRRFILSAIFIIPLLILISVIIYRQYARTAGGGDNAKSNGPEVVAMWKALDFKKIAPTEEFRGAVNAIKFSSGSDITELQRSNLFNQLYNGFIGFNDGNFESYRKFRTPTPAKLDPKFFNEQNREKLMEGAKSLMKPGEKVPSDFEEYVKVMTLRMNGGMGLSNYWDGACLTNAIVSIEKRTTPPPELLELARESENAGLFRPMQFFFPERDVKDILMEDKDAYFATFSVVVSHIPPDPPFRVYIRFFWDKKFEAWVPSEFVSTYSAQRKWALIW